MLRIIILNLVLIPTILMGQDSLKIDLNKFLDEWHADAARVYMQAYFDKIDEDGIYIGTDATENWTKQAFFEWSKPFFDIGKTWSFKAVERNIYLSEDEAAAWFDEKLEATYGMLRGSGILRLKDGSWKIMHYVLSLPVPNERFQKVLKVIKEK